MSRRVSYRCAPEMYQVNKIKSSPQDRTNCCNAESVREAEKNAAICDSAKDLPHLPASYTLVNCIHLCFEKVCCLREIVGVLWDRKLP